MDVISRVYKTAVWLTRGCQVVVSPNAASRFAVATGEHLAEAQKMLGTTRWSFSSKSLLKHLRDGGLRDLFLTYKEYGLGGLISIKEVLPKVDLLYYVQHL